MSPTVDVSKLIDPDVAAAIAAIPLNLGALSDETLAAIRAGMSQRPPLELSGKVAIADHDLAGRPGVSVRVYTPEGLAGLRPCVYWIHGGGMILGTNKGDDFRFDTWCRKYNIVGVSVEYRLAPEFPYPTPVEDCYAGLRYVYDNAEKLGVDRNRIGIGGPSAGGGLAAGTALLARDRGEIPLVFQLLIYPMIDDRQITPSSGWIDPIWPPAANTYGWKSYLGGLHGTDEVPIYAAPARAIDLSGLPPSMVLVGAIDGFSDEDIDYAKRLRHCGVTTDLRVYAGAPHGFDGLAAGTAVAAQANADIDAWIAPFLG